MKIVAPNNEAKTKFGSLSEGHVFRHDHGHVFMKTHQAHQARHNDQDTVNAVDLETGHMRGFQDYSDVTYLKDAKLVLGDE